jgi:hypothetical protein
MLPKQSVDQEGVHQTAKKGLEGSEGEGDAAQRPSRAEAEKIRS